MLILRSYALVAAALVAGAVAGCSGEIAERPAASDPSNAASAEAPFTRPPPYQPDPVLAPREPPSREPISTGYVCPMHPEIRSTKPGACPTCGMTLVPGEHEHGAHP